MADALLLISQKVLPSKLADSGYTFLQPNLASALAGVFGK
jgi:NAD dependent epimerase/dehydratase family enzyme